MPDPVAILTHLRMVADPALLNRRRRDAARIEIARGWPNNHVDLGQWFRLCDLPQAADHAAAVNRAGENIYVGVALRQGERPGDGRAADQHVLASRFAWVDFDDLDAAERLRERLPRLGLKPTLTVTTGRTPAWRGHLYFALSEPVSAGVLGATNAALVQLLDGDTHVVAPSMVLRLAGSVSYPSLHKSVAGYVGEIVTLSIDRRAPAYRAGDLIVLATQPFA